jgi:hypothetical protein
LYFKEVEIFETFWKGDHKVKKHFIKKLRTIKFTDASSSQPFGTYIPPNRKIPAKFELFTYPQG